MSGQPNELLCSIQPARVGEIAAARLRGTLVTLAAAARSGGDTTDMTYEVRTGTSIWLSRLRITNIVKAHGIVGISAAAIRKPFAGKCVKTIVRIGPIRSAIHAATKPEAALHSPVTSNSVPTPLTEISKR